MSCPLSIVIIVHVHARKKAMTYKPWVQLSMLLFADRVASHSTRSNRWPHNCKQPWSWHITTLIHWISRQHQSGSLTGHTQVKAQTNIDQATDNCFKVDYGLPLRGKLWPTTVAVGEPDKWRRSKSDRVRFFTCVWLVTTHPPLIAPFVPNYKMTSWLVTKVMREKQRSRPNNNSNKASQKKVMWQWLPNFKMTFLAVCKSLPPGHDRSKVPSHTSWKGLGM